MKNIITLIGLLISVQLFAQKVVPDLTEESEWKLHNRNVALVNENNDSYVRLDAQNKDGMYIYEKIEFENGIIEFDVKGKNVPGKSFVGIAFHVQDENTFNAIYFRPFNFKNPDKVRSGHSVQYICHPEFTWSKLREDFPEQFENPVSPVPDPEDFFHAKVVVDWPLVSVYVEKSKDPSLQVRMKSEFNKGKIGFWVGHGSDGIFKNLVVKMK